MTASSDFAGPAHATTFLTVDLDALATNYRLLAGRAAPARCAAVVKADGYGLGVGPVARTLSAAGCETFFVAHLDEAVILRRELAEAAAAPEIYVLNGLMAEDEQVFRDHLLMPVLNDLGQVERWAEDCRAHGPHPAAIHLDTGMSRLGLPRDEQETLMSEPERLRGIPLRCVMSHLACADTPDHPLNRQQQRDFAAAIGRLPKAIASLSASSGIFLGPDWHFDMVRPGVALYGVAPAEGRPNPMAPVAGLYGKIIQVRRVDAPGTVGYGATHRFAGPTRVATVAAGYADGYLRSLSGRATAYIGDVAVPLIGRVSMDLITLDISNVPHAEAGDIVELIGPHADLDAVAKTAGTIGYEILTSLGRRYRRHYVGGAG
ncbi:MAG: alanine racemase [Alphaproteobacteria bacterium]|nr:alanine racemase [Alphaproteobacteria bacterium]